MATLTAPSAIALRDLPLDGQGAVYDQIYRAIRAAVLERRLVSGVRLPATRALADELGVSRNTVLAAYDQLLAEGYAVSRVGSGTFVAGQIPDAPVGRPRNAKTTKRDAAVEPPALRLSRYGRVLADRRPRRAHDAVLTRTALPFDFRPCVPDLERLPAETWTRTVAREASATTAAELDYADPSGALALRRELCAYLARARGVVCTPDQIVVVGGVAQALDLAARLFVDPGDAVLLEEPFYQGAQRCFEAAGARIETARVDHEGIDLASIGAKELEACRLVYVTPSHQFPTGAVMSLPRRLELLGWAERSGAFILEDDYDSEFRYSGRAIEALKSLDEGGRVLYAGTFSKSLFPALRIAYLVLPPALVPLFRAAKWLSDWAAPTFEQEALASFMASGDFERHLRRARTLYAASRAALIEALRAEFAGAVHFIDSRAGLHVNLAFHALDAGLLPELVRAAQAEGVAVYPTATCYVTRPRHIELTMGFARLEPADIREGIARLARVVGALAGAPSAPSALER